MDLDGSAFKKMPNIQPARAKIAALTIGGLCYLGPVCTAATTALLLMYAVKYGHPERLLDPVRQVKLASS